MNTNSTIANASLIVVKLASVAALIACTGTAQASVNDLCIDNATETEKGFFVNNAADGNRYAKITFDSGSEQAMRVYNNNGGFTFYIKDVPEFSLTHAAAIKDGGGNWTALSDRRLKKNIQPYTEGSEKLRLVKPRTFNYNGALQFAPDDGADHIGVVAQELQQVLPEMVSEASESLGGSPVLVVDASNFTYALVNAVKEQQQAIEKLRSKTRKLEALLCAKNPQRPFCK